MRAGCSHNPDPDPDPDPDPNPDPNPNQALYRMMDDDHASHGGPKGELAFGRFSEPMCVRVRVRVGVGQC